VVEQFILPLPTRLLELQLIKLVKLVKLLAVVDHKVDVVDGYRIYNKV
jgi:hypothetical protein